jgi:hypothetical protein
MSPPANPSGTHPAGDGTATICFHTVQAQFGQGKKKKGKDGGERDVKAVHSLHLLKAVGSAVAWPKSSIRELVELLLKLSSESYDEIVRLAALEVFQVIFGQACQEMNAERLREVIQVSSHWIVLMEDDINRQTCKNRHPITSKLACSYCRWI